MTWSASGGVIDKDGRFVAGAEGTYTIRARVASVEGIASVQVAEGPVGPPLPPPQDKGIVWHGLVPPQKWMNFYTKVLSPFAPTPRLELDVSFRILPGDGAAAKREETKAVLRELGLMDDLDPR